MFERLSSVCQARRDSRCAFIGTAEKQPQIEKGSEVEVEIAINLSIQALKRFVFSVFVNLLGKDSRGRRKQGHFNL